MIAIVDYGSGNIRAIKNIYKRLNIQSELVSDPKQLLQARKIILPGVGAFDETMTLLNQSGLRESLDQLVLDKKIPVLGICVGMQIMATNSEEGNESGLDWFPARVKKFEDKYLLKKPKTPHMGWNSIKPLKQHQILSNVDTEKGFYFLHTYYFDCNHKEDDFIYTDYGIEFASAVHKNNIFGFQFHPEKSHANGINLFKNFAELD